MKQRVTYIVQDADKFSPSQLHVKAGSITLDHVDAAKEHRVTFGLDELPRPLKEGLEQWHELHIRWAAESPYSAIPPFTSRLTPGLHAFFTPLKEQAEKELCDQLSFTFGPLFKCSSHDDASTKMPTLSERFSMSPSHQYYSYLPSLEGLASFLQGKICDTYDIACAQAAASLLPASYLDIDYDAISHALVVTAFWSEADGDGWYDTISLPELNSDQRIEVGVLNQETNPDPEDIAFGGFLTVLGQDSSPKPTRFQTPTRHYPLPSFNSTTTPLTYTASLKHPTGLHPTLLLTIPQTPSLSPPNPTCKLHTHLTLPSYLFLDRHQFTDPLFLRSHNLHALRSLSGATDLEAPDWVVPQWGSAALFEIATPSSPSSSSSSSSQDRDSSSATKEEGGQEGDEFIVSIPMHLRYLPASANSSHTRVPLSWPVVFWACRAEEGAKMAASPFDRKELGYEALFGPKTRFMHVEPRVGGGGNGEKLTEWIDVPVLDLRGGMAWWVEMGTVTTVMVAFLGLCWVLLRGGGGSGEQEGGKGRGEAKKKQ